MSSVGVQGGSSLHPKLPSFGAHGGDGGRGDSAAMTQYSHAPGVLFTHLGELGGSEVPVHLSESIEM